MCGTCCMWSYKMKVVGIVAFVLMWDWCWLLGWLIESLGLVVVDWLVVWLDLGCVQVAWAGVRSSK